MFALPVEPALAEGVQIQMLPENRVVINAKEREKKLFEIQLPVLSTLSVLGTPRQKRLNL